MTAEVYASQIHATHSHVPAFAQSPQKIKDSTLSAFLVVINTSLATLAERESRFIIMWVRRLQNTARRVGNDGDSDVVAMQLTR